MTRIEEIRARWNGWGTLLTDGYKGTSAVRDDLAYLLARNAALERVAEAARNVIDKYVSLSEESPEWALCEALAALDAEGEKV
jgi:hypothetical protein